jgi:hypothetical protein
VVDEELSQRLEIERAIAAALETKRLTQLRHALTTGAAHSHYSGMPASDRHALDQLAAQRIAELRKHHTPKPKRRSADPAGEAPPTLEQFDLGLFGGPERLPRRPYCSDDLAQGVRVRGLAHALTKPYIQANPPHLRVWSIYDVDRPGAAVAWENSGLPPPGWAAVNRANGHAHLVWGLSAPVLVDSPDLRQAPLRYLCAVESAFRERLQADQGYSGLITKNPIHPLWRTLRGPQLAYELGELAAWVDLPKHMPRRKPDEIGLGRNCSLFDRLRKWAYGAIRQYWGGGLDGWNAWLSAANGRGLVYNGDFMFPLDGREVWHIAKSVAKWTWRNTTAEGYAAWRTEQGKRGGVASGKARLAASEDRRASARLMRAQGMTLQAISEELATPLATVGRWCS